MLKRVDHGLDGEEERSVGDLIAALLDDGKAYAQAELHLLRLKAEGEVDRYRRSAMLFGIAAALGLSALIALSVTLVIGFARWLGPFGGGAVVVILFAGAAYLAARAALRRIEPR